MFCSIAPDRNHRHDLAIRRSSEMHVPRCDIDGDVDKGLNAYRFKSSAFLIGVNPGPLEDIPLISPGFYPQGDLSLPAGGDQLVIAGYRTASPRLNPLYLEGLISRISYREGVPDKITLLNLHGIEQFFLNDHLWPNGCLCPTGRKTEDD
jgi:hypothetical protein